MDDLYITKDETLKFIEDGRIVTTSIGALSLDMKKLKENLNIIRLNYISTNGHLEILAYEAEDLEDNESTAFFKEKQQLTSAISKNLDALVGETEKIMDELDAMTEKLLQTIKKAKKLRDSDLFNSPYLVKYSDRDKIKEMRTLAFRDKIEKMNQE